jgi:rSAM/selenodomain-associated transferase 1
LIESTPVPTTGGAVIAFIRMPVRGKVKTRLAADTSADQALEIYLHLLGITLRQLSEFNGPVYLFYEGGLPEPQERLPSFTYYTQVDGDLGVKMQNAFSRILDIHEKAVLIGSDCPALTSAHLHQGLDALAANDVVLGPATDGGYYLLGLKKVYPSLFDNMPWGSDLVLEETISKTQQLKLTCGLLETLSDIDTKSDWDRYSAGLTHDDLPASV